MTTTVDVTPAALAVRGTYIDAVAVDELFVDHSYQRPLDTALARQLARTWDRRLAGVIEVSDRVAGQAPRYAIIDGQHRWAAAHLIDPAPMIGARKPDPRQLPHFRRRRPQCPLAATGRQIRVSQTLLR